MPLRLRTSGRYDSLFCALFFLVIPAAIPLAAVFLVTRPEPELFLTGLVFLCAGGAFAVGGPIVVRQMRAPILARCSRCGYDLRGLPSDVRDCPECGLDIRGIVRTPADNSK